MSRQTVIKPESGWPLPSVEEVVEHRDLVKFFILRDIKVKYRQTALGVLWVVLQPLLTMAVMSVVFGRVLHLSSDGVPYPLFCFAGLVLWSYFAQAVSAASASVISHVQLIEKVYFPRLIIPLVASLAGLPNLLISLALLLLLMLLYGIVTGPGVLLCIPIALLAVLLATGTGAAFAALSVRFRDVSYVVPIMLQLWLFASPVVYSSSAVPEKWRLLFALNPMTGIIEAFRSALLDTKTDAAPLFAASFLGVLIILPAGLMIFRRLERDFADVI